MSIGAGFALQQAFKNTGEALAFGCPAIFIGGSIGAMISFYLGRYVFRDYAHKLCTKYPLLFALDKAVETEGLFLLFMLRLCPLVPFSVLNFCVGFTSLTLYNFTVSLLGIIPSTIIYVYIGTGISDIKNAMKTKNLYSN